jgi:hypothetical protein
MPFPLIAIAAKKIGTKLAAKGAEKAAAKGAQGAAQKGATTAAQKGAGTLAEKAPQSFAQKSMQNIGNFEKSRYNNAVKTQQSKGDDQNYDLRIQSPQVAAPSSFHKGGSVRKSGWAKVKEGEVVLTEKQAKEMKKKKISANSETGKSSSTTAKKANKKYISLKRA